MQDCMEQYDRMVGCAPPPSKASELSKQRSTLTHEGAKAAGNCTLNNALHADVGSAGNCLQSISPPILPTGGRSLRAAHLPSRPMGKCWKI